jgi:hypothetical protein
VENEDRRTSDAAHWQVKGEEGVPQDMLMVRAMLQSLPKANCPDGFETKLQRRLAGEFAEPKARLAQRNWSLGWAGVGLGFATALVIAVVAFDVNFKAPANSVTAGGLAIPAPVATSGSVPQPSQTPVHEVSAPVEQTGVQQLAQEQPKSGGAVKDTTPRSPTALPEDLFHVVGGNGGK